MHVDMPTSHHTSAALTAALTAALLSSTNGFGVLAEEGFDREHDLCPRATIEGRRKWNGGDAEARGTLSCRIGGS